jgi:MFS family permease
MHTREKLSQVFYYFAHDKMSEVYLTIALRSFALSLIGLFIPIFFFQHGFSLMEIFTFYAYYAAFSIVLLYFVTRLAVRIGPRYNILISMPLMIITFAMIYSVNDYSWSMPLIAFVYSLGENMFWIAFHAEFTQSSSQESRSKAVSLNYMIVTTLSVVAPLIGGLILYLYSFELLFLITGVLLIMAAIPLLFVSDIYSPLDVKKISLLGEKRFNEISTFLGDGLRSWATGILWPFFIFLIGASYVSLGAIYAIVNLVGAVFGLYVSKLCIKYSPEKVLKVGSVSHSASIMVRGFMSSLSAATICTCFGAISFALLDVPYCSIFYNKANREGVFNFIFLREMVLAVSRLVFILMVIGLFYLTADVIKTFTIAFVIGSVGTLAYSLFKDD